MVVIHQFLDFIVPLLLPFGIRAVPARVAGFGREVIEIPVVGVCPVVGHASFRPGLVGPMAALEPGEAGAEMFGNTEAQAILLRGPLPFTHDIAVRPHIEGIPAMQLRVPQEEVVVVRSHADEILRAGLLVEPHQTVGIPLLRLPQRDDVLIAKFRRMAVMVRVIGVVLVARFVHAAGIPVAVHRHRLRAPMRPNAELCVPKPFGIMVVGQRIHRRLE